MSETVHFTAHCATKAWLSLTTLFFSGAFLSKDIVIDNDFSQMVIQDGGGIEFLNRHNETFGPDDTTSTYVFGLQPALHECRLHSVDG